MRVRLAAYVVWSVACNGGDDGVDGDGDGFDVSEDCDDADPDVNPGATEIWYDDTDQNCEGGDDARLAFERIPLSTRGEQPAGPRLGRDGDVVSVDLVYPNEGVDTSARSTATYDAATGEPIGESYQVLVGETLGIELGRTLDATAFPETNGIAAVSMVTEEGDLRASLVRFDEDGGWGWGGYGQNDSTDHHLDMALHVDGEVVTLVGCGPQEIAWLQGTLLEFSEVTFHYATAGDVSGQSCEVSGDEARVLGDDGVVTAYTRDGFVLVPGETWSDVADLAWDDEGFLLVRTDGSLVLERGRQEDVLPTSDLAVRARFDVSADGQLFVVYATANGDVFLVHGPLDGPWEESFVDDGLGKAEIDVEATQNVLFVGAGRSPTRGSRR